AAAAASFLPASVQAFLPPVVTLDAYSSTLLNTALIGLGAVGSLVIAHLLRQPPLPATPERVETRDDLHFQMPLAELALGLQRTKLLGDIVTMICQRSRALLEVDGAFLWLGSDTLSGSAGDAAPGIDVQGILSTAPTMINLRALRHMGHNA